MLVPTDEGLLVYSLASGRKRFQLPPGLLTGTAYVTIEPDIVPAAWEAFHHEQFVLKVLDPLTSFIESSVMVQGQWAAGAASPTAHWIALTRVHADADATARRLDDRWATDVQVIDTRYGEAPYEFMLDGHVEALTISPDGHWLYLLDHSPAQPDDAVLKRLDLQTRVLQAGEEDSRAAEPAADYLAPAGISPDGNWWAMLGVSTPRHMAFVEALDLRSGMSLTIDLPSGMGDSSLLKRYALMFVPESDALLAANPALGTLTRIQLGGLPAIVHSTSFPVWDYGAPGIHDSPPMSVRSVISPEGTKLYFTDGWDVWVWDIASDVVDGPYLIEGQINGLGLSRDGRLLYVATGSPILHALDANTGIELAWPHGREAGFFSGGPTPSPDQ